MNRLDKNQTLLNIHQQSHAPVSFPENRAYLPKKTGAKKKKYIALQIFLAQFFTVGPPFVRYSHIYTKVGEREKKVKVVVSIFQRALLRALSCSRESARKLVLFFSTLQLDDDLWLRETSSVELQCARRILGAN